MSVVRASKVGMDMTVRRRHVGLQISSLPHAHTRPPSSRLTPPPRPAICSIVVPRPAIRSCRANGWATRKPSEAEGARGSGGGSERRGGQRNPLRHGSRRWACSCEILRFTYSAQQVAYWGPHLQDEVPLALSGEVVIPPCKWRLLISYVS
jgi:hypothetical protein